MKSYIENELKRNKIPKKIINQGIEPQILLSDRCTSKPTGHTLEGLQSTDIIKLHHVSVYIGLYSVHAPCVSLSRVYWSQQVSAVLP